MPIYEYKCEACERFIEVLVRGEGPKVCGQKCRLLELPADERGDTMFGQGKLSRVLSRPAAVRNPAKIGKAAIPSDKRLGELGFTKYVKEGTGEYRKAVGDGPATIVRDSD